MICLQSSIIFFQYFYLKRTYREEFLAKLENYQLLYHTFFELYIYQGKILLKKNLKKQQSPLFLEFYFDQE